MKITKSQLKQLVKEELKTVLEEAEEGEEDLQAFDAFMTLPSERFGRQRDDEEQSADDVPAGHSAVTEANDALYEAESAVDRLADLIEKQPDIVSTMFQASPSLEDVKSKLERLGRLAQYLG